MHPAHGGRVYRHLLIRASAGTGKTFQLSNRFLELLRDGIPHDRILATTFTRKAAGEILDRVILRLAEATADAAKRQQLAKFTGGQRLERDACLRLLAQTMRQLHRLRVSTLDSFFAQIARSFSLELGLPPGWQIVDDWEDSHLRAQAIAAVLTNDTPSELRTLMNLLTKGEAKRAVSELVRETVDDLYELFLDTEPAAWQAVPRHKPLSAADLAATIQDLRAVELPAKALVTARESDIQAAENEQWETLLSKGLAAKIAQGELKYQRQVIPAEAVAIYQRLLGHVQAVLVGRVALQTEATHELLVKFDAEYQRLKYAQRALRFSDVTRRLNRLSELDVPDRLAFRLDSRLEHLLLDEFQDTAPPQWRVLKPLGERLTKGGSGYSFFCVGDVKQAIYGWRGGEAAIFDAIDSQLPGLESQTLSTSFRSSQPVIDTVNRVFQGLSQHSNLGRAASEIARWCSVFPTHQTTCQDLAGYVEVLTGPADDQVPAVGDPVLALAADKIAELVAQAPAFKIGVLVRTNQTVGQLIYELRLRQVAASEEGGNPLTDSAAVLTVLSALRLADHPGDTVARFHLATGPLGPILNLTDFRDAAEARTAAQHVRRALVAQGYGPTIYRWAEQLAGSCSRRELSRLEQLTELAYAYDQQATLRTDDFISYVESTRVSAATPAAVRVMTVHQAKGLEFDIVVLPELDGRLLRQPDAFVVERSGATGPVTRVCRYANAEIQALLPESLQRMFQAATDRGVSESLCVLYVALTRAVHALYVIVPASKANEKSLPGTYAGLLRAALKDAQPVPPQTVIYSHGDPQWYRTAGPEARAAESDSAAGTATLPPIEVTLAAGDGERRRGWERARPSGLEGGQRVNVRQVLRGERSEALLRGQLIHAWFEQVRWIEDGPPDEALLRRVAAGLLSQHEATGLDVDRLLPQFSAMLAQPAVRDLLSQRRYQQLEATCFPPAVRQILQRTPGQALVQNERKFAVRDGDQLLAGSIDRLVLLQHESRPIAAEVLDYKTDALTPGDGRQLAEKIAFYAPQLQAYRRAVAKFSGLAPDHVQCWLAFVELGLVERVA